MDKPQRHKYRLVILSDVDEMRSLAEAIRAIRPTAANEIDRQIREIQDSEVNLHSKYTAESVEPEVGLCESRVVFVDGYREKPLR